jgi:hypothetical protein
MLLCLLHARLFRDGFHADSVQQQLARPNDLTRVGMVKPAHMRAILGESKMKEIEDEIASNKLTEERAKMEKERKEFESMKAAMEAAKARAELESSEVKRERELVEKARLAMEKASQTANEVERKAQMEKAEGLKREAEAEKKRVEETRRVRELEEQARIAKQQAEGLKTTNVTTTVEKNNPFTTPSATPVVQNMSNDYEEESNNYATKSNEESDCRRRQHCPKCCKRPDLGERVFNCVVWPSIKLLSTHVIDLCDAPLSWWGIHPCGLKLVDTEINFDKYSIATWLLCFGDHVCCCFDDDGLCCFGEKY